jgi:hypothetical protein
MRPFIVCSAVGQGPAEILVVHKPSLGASYGVLHLPHLEQAVLQELRVPFEAQDGYLLHRSGTEQDLRYVLSACRLALEPFALEYTRPQQHSHPYLQWIRQQDMPQRLHSQDASAFFDNQEDVEALKHYLAH